ncbi:MAG: hypothetical protein JWR69_3358 [Pedosphaera sp.]|nr:hypothetical protein [Pedosphaera sp.]
MSLINFILNLAGLLLWLNWLSLRFDPLARTSATSLVGTLRKADPTGPKRWKFLAALMALVFFRALIFFGLGPAIDWTPTLELGVITLPFRSDLLQRVLLFSALDLTLTLGIFYLWLLLLSVANTSVPDDDPLQRLVRLHVRWVERWPKVIKFLLPLLVAGLFWLALHPLLSHLNIIPRTTNPAHLAEEAVTIGLGTYLAWKYLIAGVLLLHLLNSYVYLGNHALWNFINLTARNLLVPLRWLPLRLGKLDFAPPVAIALLFLIAHFSGPWLTILYARLPF